MTGLVRLGIATQLLVATGLLAGGAVSSLGDLKLLRTLELRGATYHVQGIDVDERRLWVTSCDREKRKGYLHQFSLAGGELERAIEIQDGDRYHPGGIAADEASIWIPIAEYRPASTTLIEQRDKRSLAVRFRFLVPDHIGCLAAGRGVLVGGNWDSREFYVWDRRGRLIRKVANPTGNSFQDLKFDRGELAGAGIVRDGAPSGAIDWLEFPSLRLKRRLGAGRTDRGVLFTSEGMAIRGGRLFLLPEDGPSRLFVFELTR